MSKPHKTDFKALISGMTPPPAEEVLPAAEPTSPTPPPTPPAAVPLRRPRAIVRAVAPQPVTGEGTLKERATQMSLYLEPPVYDQLRDIAYHERTKIHPLILEGIDLLLKKRGSPSIKELVEKAQKAG